VILELSLRTNFLACLSVCLLSRSLRRGRVLNRSVHDDVQLCQWLATKDGNLILGDFNRAEVMDYNPRKGTYCKYNNGGGWGNVSVYTRRKILLRADPPFIDS
jgi:hypothetical protein